MSHLNLTPSQVEELCPQHPGETLIAFDRGQNKLLCNRCIWEIQLNEEDINITFTSLIAADINEMLTSQYAQYNMSKEQFRSDVQQKSVVEGQAQS
ncbi:hypothetical protein FGO68_gene14527 [Halteria grandinella]|uniref:Uncharacterized protein n=1 Tax=Halteria grandinella TaxID=5974 RepID=A0A8J8N982_HALGN|nr:hypothetical protein FGO68_gene14527 [Halteria grandinella]